jgi:Tfp pilus assembly ATPase PilU
MKPEHALKFVNDLLRALIALKSQELVLAAGRPPSMLKKQSGGDVLTPVSEQELSPVHVRELTRAVMSEEQASQLKATGTCEFAYSAAALGNFQARAIAQLNNESLVLRVATAVPTKDSKGMLAG